ncbi:MAG: hypothetical protein KatS3mg091_388 [Patescibacteria group bacterium]|nr:MAG: hypothetical protein KatS3mg091_388 [Patescibacteria group bacterium]
MSVIRVKNSLGSFDLLTINKLLKQLSSQDKSVDLQGLRSILSQDNVFMFVFRQDQSSPILGIVFLVKYQTITGIHCRLEDLVVDEACRGRGIGTALVLSCIKFAKSLSAEYLDLTSNPTRIYANKLYQKLGFQKRKTNVYRLKL